MASASLVSRDPGCTTESLCFEGHGSWWGGLVRCGVMCGVGQVVRGVGSGQPHGSSDHLPRLSWWSPPCCEPLQVCRRSREALGMYSLKILHLNAACSLFLPRC